MFRRFAMRYCAQEHLAQLSIAPDSLQLHASRGWHWEAGTMHPNLCQRTSSSHPREEWKSQQDVGTFHFWPGYLLKGRFAGLLNSPPGCAHAFLVLVLLCWQRCEAGNLNC
ncbi:hypothetical protein FKM82_020892 [Ascaphus truei]